jgi:hypothetical protein
MEVERQTDPERRFEERWLRWARRPPRLAPEEAARRVSDALQQRRARRSASLALVAAAAVLAVALPLSLPRTPPTPALDGGPAAGTAQVGLGENQVLIWIDEETPLYMTFQAPEAAPQAGELR